MVCGTGFGTDLGYGATTTSWTALHWLCGAQVLLSPYASLRDVRHVTLCMSGTEPAYRAICLHAQCAVPGTQIARDTRCPAGRQRAVRLETGAMECPVVF
eukprot:3935664-Rhodomonas_salina.2